MAMLEEPSRGPVAMRRQSGAGTGLCMAASLPLPARGSKAEIFWLHIATSYPIVDTEVIMEEIREQLQIFVRRYGLLNAACCDACCGEAVSLVQSHILFEVRRQQEPSMQQVADELGIDITTFSRQIKAMEERRLLERRPSAKDRRVNLLA